MTPLLIMGLQNGGMSLYPDLFGYWKYFTCEFLLLQLQNTEFILKTPGIYVSISLKPIFAD